MMRQCDGCTLCCKLLPVPAFGNPADKWCPQCIIGGGCGIYSTRPDDCRAFKCQWLLGSIPENLKPDRVRAVLYTSEEGRRLIVHCDAGMGLHPDLAEYLTVLRLRHIPFLFVKDGETRDVR